ncbi:MAG: amidohydrolase [Eubacteriales bacterium]|nr:amidohydrolase [Eubacteriales bacterium]
MNKADFLFRNGSVVTINHQNEIAQAVAVADDKILYVGDNHGTDEMIGPATHVIDLQGRSVTPGFIDCHLHPILYGLFGGAIVDITWPICRSIADIQELIREEVRKTPKGQWIELWGYDQNKLSDRRHVTIDDLDAVAPEHPVQCMRICGHLGVYNSLGLAAGGIHTPADASKFGKNEVVVENGRLTGMAKDNTNFYLWSLIQYTADHARDALRRTNAKLIKTGITSVHCPGERADRSYTITREAIAKGEFLAREYAFVNVDQREVADAVHTGMATGTGDAHFRFGAYKIFVDGGTSGPSCATRQPYSHDPNLPGILSCTQEFVDAKLSQINAANCQGTAHAVGDLAVEMMLSGYEKALAACPRTDSRHRIEHCGLTDPQLIERMVAMNIIPVSNTHFLTINGSDYHRYFGNRVDSMFAMRSYLDAGLHAVIGCDAPTADESVMRGLDGAVNRTDRRTGESIGPMQRISMLEAIRCYTLNGAYASFEEDVKGSLEVGKLADIALLSQDILAYPPEKVMDIQVDLTMIGGKVVYERKP